MGVKKEKIRKKYNTEYEKWLYDMRLKSLRGLFYDLWEDIGTTMMWFVITMVIVFGLEIDIIAYVLLVLIAEVAHRNNSRLLENRFLLAKLIEQEEFLEQLVDESVETDEVRLINDQHTQINKDLELLAIKIEDGTATLDELKQLLVEKEKLLAKKANLIEGTYLNINGKLITHELEKLNDV